MGEVGDGGSTNTDPGQTADLDAFVVLDLGDGGPHHVHQLDGLAPLAGGGGAGEDHEAFGVPPHTGGEVVEAEQVGEFVAVLGAALHRVQQGELAVQEDLVAAGEVDEDLGDAASHVRLLDGGLDGGPLEGVERLADLADLVGFVTEVRGLGLDVDLFARGQPAHHARQPDAGDLVGVLAQPGEVADEFTADADGDEDRDDQGQEAEDPGDPGLGEDPVGGRFGAVLETVAHLRGVAGQPVQDGHGRLFPAVGVDGGGALRRPGADQGVLGGAQGFGVGAAPELLDAAAFGGGEVLQADLVEQLALRHEAGYLAQFGGGEAAGDEAGGDERVLAREHLAGPGDADQGPHLLVHRHVLKGVESVEEAVRGVDEAVVEVQGLCSADGALLDRLAQRLQSVDGTQDRVQAAAVGGAQRFPDVLLPGVLPDLAHDAVGGGALPHEHGERVGGPGVGEEDQGLPSLVLDGADGVLQGFAHLLHDGSGAHQFVGLTAGDVGGEDPEAREGDERHQQQRHDLPADGLPAKAHGLPQIGPARRLRGSPRAVAARVVYSVNKRREPTTDTETTRRHVRMIFSRPTGT
ncbi:hypothetical protein P376_5365 [Streptomyces sp. HCCB10043]|nr:hypothetical protein P376_5365 [Streptomyces sp. HCCB10043]